MSYYHLFWDHKTNTPHVVKSGFNFWAVIFFPFYFIVIKAWYSFGIYVAGSLFLSAIATFFDLPENLSLMIFLAYNIFIGFDTAESLWGEYHKKGYKFLKSGFYETPLHAQEDAFNFK